MAIMELQAVSSTQRGTIMPRITAPQRQTMSTSDVQPVPMRRVASKRSRKNAQASKVRPLRKRRVWHCRQGENKRTTPMVGYRLDIFAKPEELVSVSFELARGAMICKGDPGDPAAGYGSHRC